MPRQAFGAEQLRAVLDYRRDTGEWTWKVRQSNAVPAGAKAGTLKSNGRIYINVFTEAHLAHRLAWLYETGEWPKGAIRQRDGNLADSRFENLYEATRTEVNVSRRLGQNNTSGRVGVTFNKRRGKWRAQIKRDWKIVALGYFATFEEACVARAEAEQHLTAAPEEYERHIEHETMRNRQRIAWHVLCEKFAGRIEWKSFGAFCADVGAPPGPRYLVEPLDDSQFVGPDNFDWVPPPSVRYDMKTRAGRRAQKLDEMARNRYGFKSEADKRAYMATHGNCCAICGIIEGAEYVGSDGERHLAVMHLDHNHATGVNRGVLCDRCNRGVGCFRDDPSLLRAAIAYLAEWGIVDDGGATVVPLRKESA